MVLIVYRMYLVTMGKCCRLYACSACSDIIGRKPTQFCALHCTSAVNQRRQSVCFPVKMLLTVCVKYKQTLHSASQFNASVCGSIWDVVLSHGRIVRDVVLSQAGLWVVLSRGRIVRCSLGRTAHDKSTHCSKLNAGDTQKTDVRLFQTGKNQNFTGNALAL